MYVQEREGDGKLARDKQRQVYQAGGGAARMTAGIAPEAILEKRLGVRPVGHALADVGRDQLVQAVPDILAADNVLGPVLHVRVTAGQGIRPRLPTHVLHTVGDEPGARQGHREAEPADVQLPELAFPYKRLGRAGWYRVAGDKGQRDDEDYANGDAAAEGYEEPCGYGLVFCKWESVRLYRYILVIILQKGL